MRLPEDRRIQDAYKCLQRDLLMPVKRPTNATLMCVYQKTVASTKNRLSRIFTKADSKDEEAAEAEDEGCGEEGEEGEEEEEESDSRQQQRRRTRAVQELRGFVDSSESETEKARRAYVPIASKRARVSHVLK